MTLKAAEKLAAAPFTDIPGRLRILADQIGDEVEALLVVTYPRNTVMGFGRALTRAELVGTLSMAAHEMMVAD